VPAAYVPPGISGDAVRGSQVLGGNGRYLSGTSITTQHQLHILREGGRERGREGEREGGGESESERASEREREGGREGGRAS